MSLAYKSTGLGYPESFSSSKFCTSINQVLAVSNPVGKDKRVNSVLLERKQTTKALKELF